MLWLLDESFNKKSSQTNNCCFIDQVQAADGHGSPSVAESGSRRPLVPVCCRVRQLTPSGPVCCRVRQLTPSGPRLLPSQAADALWSPSAAESGRRLPRVPVICRVRQRTPTGLRQLPSQAAAPGIRQRRLFGELLSQVTHTARNLITNLIKFRKTRILLITVRVDYTSRPGSLKSECYQLPFV